MPAITQRTFTMHYSILDICLTVVGMGKMLGLVPVFKREFVVIHQDDGRKEMENT